jgi:hypothetical protein
MSDSRRAVYAGMVYCPRCGVPGGTGCIKRPSSKLYHDERWAVAYVIYRKRAYEMLRRAENTDHE